MRLLVLAFLAFAFVPSAQAQGSSKNVDVLVVVPATYSSNATPDQAVSALQSWLGQPTDAPCIGSQYCSIEGWFRHELGEVFDYDIQVIPITLNYTFVDACGSFQGIDFYLAVDSAVSAAASVNYGGGQRIIELVMGAGGWAGHFSPADKGRRVDHMGLVGDWGVMQQYGVPNACQPIDSSSPSHGFSHEFAGMMGEYITAGYNEGGLFIGDVMSLNERTDLLKWSAKWLRIP